VVFDCSAVAPNLVESEIFGHVAGAFTGASTTRSGLFQQAHRGTMFLDELGELPKELQPKLLRVLEKGEVRRLGSTRSEKVDVRIVAATNRNLPEEVKRGNFRDDIYYRVSGAHLHVPPLRARLGDLPLLVGHFLSLHRPARTMADIPPHVWEMFQTYRWPGNVRELKNATQRLLVMPDRPLAHLEASARPPSDRPDANEALLPLREARREASDAFEQSYVSSVLGKANNNVTRAAAIAEVSRQMMQKLMRKHGL
jgi:transcriptional regulator with GAF, ATPase, and Fis domain